MNIWAWLIAAFLAGVVVGRRVGVNEESDRRSREVRGIVADVKRFGRDHNLLKPGRKDDVSE